MANDPYKAEQLKYLVLLVRDWHSDCMLLGQAVAKVSANSVRRATAVPPEIPDPPPPQELSPRPEDYEWCDAYFRMIARNNYVTALALLHLGPDPHGGDLARSLGYGEEKELNATTEWMRLISGLFKSMLYVYPSTTPPGPVPEKPASSPTDNEGQLWKGLKDELESLARDQMEFVNSNWSGKAMQMPQVGRADAPSSTDCVGWIEKSAHQIFMDLCRIANHLPDHFPPPGPGVGPLRTK